MSRLDLESARIRVRALLGARLKIYMDESAVQEPFSISKQVTGLCSRLAQSKTVDTQTRRAHLG